MATTAPPAQRIVTLDVLRGVAVLGILLMNIQAFALPLAAYVNPAALGAPSAPALAVWAIEYVAIDGKMRGLFTLLFGASALLVMDRAEAAGLAPARVHVARVSWLLAFGLVHFYGLWSGDILVEYAAVGLLLPIFRPLPTPILAALAALILALSTAAGWAQLFGPSPDPAFLAANYGRDPGEVARDLQLYGEGSYRDLLAHRSSEEGWWPWWSIRDHGLETLALMLAGMALLRAGLLSGQWPAPRLTRWAALALGLGFAGDAALAWWQWRGGFAARDVYHAVNGLSLPFHVAATIGWAALLARFAQGNYGALRRRLAAAGRMAFSNYLVTSLVMTSLFYGYGLGLFGQFDRPALLLVVLAMWAAILLWSPWWLDRFAYGPLEWLWRSLARGRRQRLRLRA